MKIFLNCFLILMLLASPICTLSATATTNVDKNRVSSTQKLFVKNVVQILYNIDYQNYENQFNQASKFFTESAWKNYKNLNDEFLKGIVWNKLSISSKIIEPIRVSQSNSEITTTVIILTTFNSPSTSFAPKKFYKFVITLISTPEGFKISNFIEVDNNST